MVNSSSEATALNVRKHRTSLKLLVCVVATLLVIPAAAYCQDRRISREYQLKAAIFYKLVGFIDWEGTQPDVDGKVHIEICTLGANPFGNALARFIAIEPIESKTVTLRAIEDPREAESCQLVYLSRSEQSNAARILHELKDIPCVTVSDINGFAQKGGMIELFVDGQFIRFIINAARARENGIRLSSHLLALAKQVLGND